jgi:hypothetical protein
MRMMPSGQTMNYGRSISPNIVEYVIANGSSRSVLHNGVGRIIYTCGDVQVVTENQGGIVVSVLNIHGY